MHLNNDVIKGVVNKQCVLVAIFAHLVTDTRTDSPLCRRACEGWKQHIRYIVV